MTVPPATASISAKDFLITFEAEVAQHWDSARADHAGILEAIANRALPNLMAYDDENPHDVLALRPDPVKRCTATIRNCMENAQKTETEFVIFEPAAAQDLDSILESSNEDLYVDKQPSLQAARDREILVVDGTRVALENMQNKSITQALLLMHSQEAVSQMDDEKKSEQYEKMQNQLHREHVKQVKAGASQLLAYGQLPHLHQKVHARKQLLKALRRKSELVTSNNADRLYADLQEQQAEVDDKKKKCGGLRRATIRDEKAKRGALLKAREVYQKALKEYQAAYLQNEAAAIVEEDLALASDQIKEELEAAELARSDTKAQCDACAVKAAECVENVSASIQAVHKSLLAYSEPTVEEAWKNSALASELCKCLMAAKRAEIDFLSQEHAESEKRAQKQKQPIMKAKTLEKVEQLQRQIYDTKVELAQVEVLGNRAEDQIDSFRALKSGLDEATIRSFGEDVAKATYGTARLYVSDNESDDSTEASGPTTTIQQHMPNPLDKLRIEMEEKFKIEKQQMKAEFQLEKQQMMEMMREEIRAELQREDASSVTSFEHVDS